MSEPKTTEIQHAEALARRFLDGQLSRRDLLKRAGKFSAAAIALSSLGAVVAACGGTTATAAPASGGSSPGASAAPKSGGTLLAALTGEPDTLDPATSAIYTATQVFSHIFSTLVAIDENNEFYGVLATKWDQPDPQTWVFDLVDNATFHNGEKFTAEDVEVHVRPAARPATGHIRGLIRSDRVRRGRQPHPGHVPPPHTFGPLFIIPSAS
jgi:peptide/nickel transport system substrate-binding protein